MATKKTCRVLAKVSDEEPIFVLRAQDKFAPILVRLWADMVIELTPEMSEAHLSEERLDEAFQCAKAMEAWPTRKFPD